MALASYYVVGAVLSTLERKAGTEECLKVFEKFLQRYPEDRELNRVYWNFRRILPLREDGKLSEIKKNLERLRDARKLTLSYPFISSFR